MHPPANSEKKVIEALEPFVTPARKNRIEEVITSRLSGIHLAMEAPSDIHNAWAAVRSAEAFGIFNIHIIAPEGDVKRNNGVTKGSAYWVNIHWHENLDKFLAYIRCEKIILAGAIVDAEKNVSALADEGKICVLFGNEQRGLTQKARENCDILFSIPMYGMVESFNLSVATAISLYDLSSRRRNFLNGKIDLTDEEILQLRSQYYLQSVDPRLAENIAK